MYSVDNLYKYHGKHLELELVAGDSGMHRCIKYPDAHRPGLSLSGYMKGHPGKRILIFGKAEIEYLDDLHQTTRISNLEAILSSPIQPPAIIITGRYKLSKELVDLCNKYNIPLLRTHMTSMNFLNNLTMLLMKEFSPSINCHGTLMDVFGVGILIQGDSSCGKSETALGLIERRHRLITDDFVKVKKHKDGYLEGFSAELTRHHMEIRGIGIINVAHMYGAICVRDRQTIDVVVKLEAWNDHSYYDRVGIDEKFCDILNVKLPHHVLPVKPGRNIVLLLETIALNHKLKCMGYNSAKEFNEKLIEMIVSKN